MPIYEYRRPDGTTFEVMQRMTDDPIAVCETCSAPVQRVYHPVAVHFKGSGFYNTDYGKRKRGGASDSDSSGGSDSGKDKKESKAKDSSSSASTPASKDSSKDSSSSSSKPSSKD
jgi:putative FmdB family regulatory protein